MVHRLTAEGYFQTTADGFPAISFSLYIYLPCDTSPQSPLQRRLTDSVDNPAACIYAFMSSGLASLRVDDSPDLRRRSVLLKQTNFTKKHGRRHHGFDKEKAPYPVSYDRLAVDLWVTSSLSICLPPCTELSHAVTSSTMSSSSS